MAQVQGDGNLRDDDSRADRRSDTTVNRANRLAYSVVHSRWLAMFVVAFAVSWSFHIVEERGDREHQRQTRIMECTIQGVADEQASEPRTLVKPILEACTKQEDKR